MHMMRSDGAGGINWQKGASAVICLGAGVLLTWLFFRYALGVALPFFLAWLLSLAVKPAIRWLCAKGRLPRPLVAGVLVTLLVGGAVFLSVRGIRRAVDELGRLIGELVADKDGVVAAVSGLFERAGSLSEHIPFLKHLEDAPFYGALCEKIDAMVGDGIDRLAASVGARLPDAAMAVAGWLPGAFVFVTVLLIAAYYFSADDGRLARSAKGMVTRLLPPSWQTALPRVGRRLGRLGRQYAKAYLLLGLFTFLEVFIGLSVLGVRYAFVLSLLIAVVDFLPLLGTGIILVPWGIVCLLLGQYRLGVGLCILYGLCTLLRQIMEPRIVGKGLGLHPLLSLVAMYAGLRLFGFGGMLLLPLLVAGVKNVLLDDIDV